MRHSRVHSVYDPRDSLSPSPQSFKPWELIHLLRSSFDCSHRGFTKETANDPRWLQAQRNMAREMRRSHDSLQRGGRVGAIDHLVRVFDDFWFRGMLVGRMQARVSARVGHDSVLAETTSYSRWLPWRRRVTIRFSVEVSKAVLRERHVKEGKPRPNVFEYQQFVSGVLVHEMAHAVIAVYACQCAECKEEFKEVDGPDGHGAGWMKLQQAVERSAEEYGLPVLDFRCAEELYWAEMMGWKC